MSVGSGFGVDSGFFSPASFPPCSGALLVGCPHPYRAIRTTIINRTRTAMFPPLVATPRTWYTHGPGPKRRAAPEGPVGWGPSRLDRGRLLLRTSENTPSTHSGEWSKDHPFGGYAHPRPGSMLRLLLAEAGAGPPGKRGSRTHARAPQGG